MQIHAIFCADFLENRGKVSQRMRVCVARRSGRAMTAGMSIYLRLGAIALLSAMAACGSDGSSGAGTSIVGVFDATNADTSGNSKTERLWFDADGTWGSSTRITAGNNTTNVCGTKTADAKYDLRSADTIVLRDGTTSVEKKYALLEGGAVLKLDPATGTPTVNSYKRVDGAATKRTCDDAFR
jgi:hypothetical protein